MTDDCLTPLEIADLLAKFGVPLTETGALTIRKQHKAIVKLREALMKVNADVQEGEFAQSVPFSLAFVVNQSVIKALKDTENLTHDTRSNDHIS